MPCIVHQAMAEADHEEFYICGRCGRWRGTYSPTCSLRSTPACSTSDATSGVRVEQQECAGVPLGFGPCW
jgi:hypothetical protein